MTRLTATSLTGVLALAVPILAGAPAAQQPNPAPAINIEHGRYLAEDVAMCVQCHSPRDAHGNLIPDRLFQGSPIPLRSPWPDSEWAILAPRIAGLPQYTSEQGVRLLTEGIDRKNAHLRPPMPRFRMNQQDAADVVAFLKSLEWK